MVFIYCACFFLDTMHCPKYVASVMSGVTNYNSCILHYDVCDALHNLLHNKVYMFVFRTLIHMNGICHEVGNCGQSVVKC